MSLHGRWGKQAIDTTDYNALHKDFPGYLQNYGFTVAFTQRHERVSFEQPSAWAPPPNQR
jgi:hypothetical protein